MSQLVTIPSPILRQPAKPVTSLDTRVQEVLQDMEKILKKAVDPAGVGLAAPQIGESLAIFMIRPTGRGKITTFINPQIIKYSQRQNQPTGKRGVYEGCLSLPHHYAPIKRSTSVTVRFQTPVQPGQSERAQRDRLDRESSTRDWAGELIEKTEVFSGFPAHVIQHEMDHLNGILFIDRMLEQNSKLYKVEGEEWVEVSL